MALTSRYASTDGPVRGSSWLRILPFVILLLGAIVLALAWKDIPDHVLALVVWG